jgi:hypothetical protein
MIRRQPLLAAFVALYMLGFTAKALLGGNTEFVFYAAVMVVLIAGVALIHSRVTFSTPLLWGLAIWGLLHMAGGNVPIPYSLAPDFQPEPGQTATVLYNLRFAPFLPRYDQFTHAYGFATATLASFQALAAAVGPSIFVGGSPRGRVKAGIAVACLLMGIGLGALNEVVEFAATRFMRTNVGDFVNTGWDLVSNLTGATLAAVSLYMRSPLRPDNQNSP